MTDLAALDATAQAELVHNGDASAAELVDAAIARIRSAFAKAEPLQGWQVDAAARDVIEKAGYGEQASRTNLSQARRGKPRGGDQLRFGKLI